MKSSEGKTIRFIGFEDFEKFDSSQLKLGNLKDPSTPTEAIAAIFDLQGFTQFCRQIDPHLGVPVFMSQFLTWLMTEVRLISVIRSLPGGFQLRHPLPFYTKFLGDGLLVLWSTEGVGNITIMNFVTSCCSLCSKYTTEFRPKLLKSISDAPKVLRCGMARGRVYSVGSDADFVGSCINMAARIQKMPGTTFAFNIRGFNFDSAIGHFVRDNIVVKRIKVRGIGDEELIGILKHEADSMCEEDKKQYLDPFDG